MTDLPICGATWNGVGLTYICDQAPGHTGRHYAGHDGERIGWQPDTPATCGSRTRGGFGTTYDCDQPAGHDGAHRTHRDGEYVAGWTDDAAEQPAPDSAGQAAPGPLRDDDLRQQHRRTAAFILDRLEPRCISARTVAELRRVTAAEEAECDNARAAVAEARASADKAWKQAAWLGDRLDQQAERTRKARRQRDEAAADRDMAHVRADRARDDLNTARADAERYKTDHLNACRTIAEMHAAATGRNGEGPARGVVEDMADLRDQLTRCQQDRDAAWAALDGERELAATNRREANHLRRQFADALDEPRGRDWEALINRAAAYRARAAELEHHGALAEVRLLRGNSEVDRREASARRVALAEALGLDTGSGWDTITKHAQRAGKRIAELRAESRRRGKEVVARNQRIAGLERRAEQAEQRAAAPLTYTAAEVDARDAAAQLNAHAELADALGLAAPRSWADMLDQVRVTRYVAKERLDLMETARDALEAAGQGRVHGPDLVPAIEALAADRAEAARFKERWDHWKAKARELEADRDRLAAEVESSVRAAQGWMAADLDAALGYAHRPGETNGGHKSWADWWAELVAEARRRSDTAEPATDAPDLTAPVSPREVQPISHPHPLYDVLDAMTGEPISDADARRRIGRYYNAITNAPAARDAIDRAVSSLRAVLG